MKRSSKKPRRSQSQRFILCEALEPRQLLSAAVALPQWSTPAASPHTPIKAQDALDDWLTDSYDDTPPDTQPYIPPDTNPGDTDSGDYGSGDMGSGDTGSGDMNSGDYGSGDYDSGDYGSGDDSTYYSPDCPPDYPLVFPPAAPTHLTLTALSPRAISLSWRGDLANSDGFEILRLNSNGWWNPIADVYGQTHYTDTNLTPNTRYTYTVQAFNDGGFSDPAPCAAITTPDIPRPPIGSINVLNAAGVTGWTFDRNTPQTPVLTSIFIDGAQLQSAPADLYRLDLGRNLGAARHGFSINLPSLTPGIHRLDVFAADTANGQQFRIASRTFTANHAPIGFIDNLTLTTLQGWTLDADTPNTPLQLRYSIDNNAPTLVTADIFRADLLPHFATTNHGFSIALPQLTAGAHQISIFTADSTDQSLTLLATRKLTITNAPSSPLPKGWLDVATNKVVAGWAFNPANPAAPVSVRVDIDGILGTPNPTVTLRPDLAKLVGPSHLGFTQWFSLTPGQHRLDLYMLTTPDATPTLLASRLVGTLAPRAYIDILNPTVAKGWAFAAGGKPLIVRLDIDNLHGAALTAGLPRPDLAAIAGPIASGFTLPTPHLAPGLHHATLVLIDPLTLNPISFLTRQFITT